MIYYLDTNIISYLLEGRSEILQKFIDCARFNTIKIPLIVYYEIKRGLLAKNANRQLLAFENFCEAYGIESYL